MTDQGTHLMDVVQWFTNAPPPKAAIGMGYVAKNTGAEHPEIFSSTLDHGKFLTTWELNYCNDFEGSWSSRFMGDQGTMRLDNAGFVVGKEQWKDNRTPFIREDAPVPIEPHVQNFLDCIKSRQQPNCPVEIAQRAVAGPHLANIAMSLGRQVRLADDLVTVSQCALCSLLFFSVRRSPPNSSSGASRAACPSTTPFRPPAASAATSSTGLSARYWS